MVYGVSLSVPLLCPANVCGSSFSVPCYGCVFLVMTCCSWLRPLVPGYDLLFLVTTFCSWLRPFVPGYDLLFLVTTFLFLAMTFCSWPRPFVPHPVLARVIPTHSIFIINFVFLSLSLVRVRGSCRRSCPGRCTSSLTDPPSPSSVVPGSLYVFLNGSAVAVVRRARIVVRLP